MGIVDMRRFLVIFNLSFLESSFFFMRNERAGAKEASAVLK